MPAAPEILYAALVDICLAVDPVRRWPAGTVFRDEVVAALHRARLAMEIVDGEGVVLDFEGLKKLAARADEEAAQEAGYRKDLKG